jgi:hypothetical protein
MWQHQCKGLRSLGKNTCVYVFESNRCQLNLRAFRMRLAWRTRKSATAEQAIDTDWLLLANPRH